MDDSLKQRGNALENAFYREKDKQLLDNLRAELKNNEAREALSHATGLDDDPALTAMVENNITAETLTSVSLIPLVAVAWADGIMEDAERKAVLDAAHQSGVAEGTAAHALLDSWLDHKPEDSLLDAWKAYIHALNETLDATSLGQLKAKVLGRAQEVAESAGGFLGFNAVKEVEKRLIDELAHAFD